MPSESDVSINGRQSPPDRERDMDSEVDFAASLDSNPDMAPIEWGPVRFERLRSPALAARL